MTSTVHRPTSDPSPAGAAGAPSITRAAAGAGIAGAAIFVAGTLAGGMPLAPDAALADVVERFTDHRGAVLVGAALVAVALGPLLVFLDGLRRTVGAAGTATVAAWVLLIGIISAGTAPLTALTWRGVADADPGTLQLAFDLGNLATYALSAVPALVSVAAPTWALRRAGAVPGWLLGLAGAEIVVNVIEVAGLASRTGTNAAGYAAGLGPLLWMAWLVGLAVVLGRRGR